MHLTLKSIGSLAVVGLLAGCMESSMTSTEDTTHVDEPDSVLVPADRTVDQNSTRQDVTVLKPAPEDVTGKNPETDNPIPKDTENTTEPTEETVAPHGVQPGNTGNEEGYKAPRAKDDPQVQVYDERPGVDKNLKSDDIQ